MLQSCPTMVTLKLQAQVVLRKAFMVPIFIGDKRSFAAQSASSICNRIVWKGFSG